MKKKERPLGKVGRGVGKRIHQGQVRIEKQRAKQRELLRSAGLYRGRKK